MKQEPVTLATPEHEALMQQIRDLSAERTSVPTCYSLRQIAFEHATPDKCDGRTYRLALPFGNIRSDDDLSGRAGKPRVLD